MNKNTTVKLREKLIFCFYSKSPVYHRGQTTAQTHLLTYEQFRGTGKPHLHVFGLCTRREEHPNSQLAPQTQDLLAARQPRTASSSS